MTNAPFARALSLSASTAAPQDGITDRQVLSSCNCNAVFNAASSRHGAYDVARMPLAASV